MSPIEIFPAKILGSSVNLYGYVVRLEQLDGKTRQATVGVVKVKGNTSHEVVAGRIALCGVKTNNFGETVLVSIDYEVDEDTIGRFEMIKRLQREKRKIETKRTFLAEKSEKISNALRTICHDPYLPARTIVEFEKLF